MKQYFFFCRGGDETLSFVLVLQVRSKIRRVKTIYDCEADNEDELAFAEGEVIIVTGEEDQEWWVGTSRLQLTRNLRSVSTSMDEVHSGFYTFQSKLKAKFIKNSRNSINLL